MSLIKKILGKEFIEEARKEQEKNRETLRIRERNKTLEILKGSWVILKSNKKLLWLSIIPTFIIGFILLGTFSFLLFYYLNQGEFIKNTLFYISLFLALILSSFIYFYFRGMLIYCIYKLLKKEKISFKEAFSVAQKNCFKIIKWTIVDNAMEISTSGLARQETGYATALPAMIARATWRLLTIFVVPVIIIENLSVKNATVKSFTLFTKVWAKATVFELSVKWFFIIIGLVGVFIIPVLIAALLSPISSLVNNYIEVTIGMAYGLFLSILLILGIIITTLREIFVVVLYNYAKSGKFPKSYFKEETIKGAFR